MARSSYRANTGRCLADPRSWWDAPGQQVGFYPSGRGPDRSHWRGPFASVGTPTGRPWPYMEDIPKYKNITDGVSNTLFIGEGTSKSSTGSTDAAEANRRRRTFWAYTYTSYNKSGVVAQTRTLLFDYARCVDVGGPGGSNPCKRAWGALHPGGLHFAFGDGSVHFISTDIDMEIFAGMATMAGGEVNRPYQ